MARLRQSLRTSLLAQWCLWSQSIALTSGSLTVSVAPAVPLTETMYKYDVVYDTGGKGDYDLRCSMVYLFRNDMGDSTTQLKESSGTASCNLYLDGKWQEDGRKVVVSADLVLRGTKTPIVSASKGVFCSADAKPVYQWPIASFDKLPDPPVDTATDYTIPLTYDNSFAAVNVRIIGRLADGSQVVDATSSPLRGTGSTNIHVQLPALPAGDLVEFTMYLLDGGTKERLTPPLQVQTTVYAGGTPSTLVGAFEVAPPQFVGLVPNGMIVEPALEFSAIFKTSKGAPRAWVTHFVPGSPDRFITVHREGFVFLFKTLQPRPLESDAIEILSYRDKVNARGDNGLYSCQFDPEWPATPYMYCAYTSDIFKDPLYGNDYPNPSQSMYNQRPAAWKDACTSQYGNGDNCEGFMHVERFEYDPALFDSALPGEVLAPIAQSVVLLRDFCSDGAGHGCTDLTWLTPPGAKDPYLVLAVGDRSKPNSGVAYPGSPTATMCWNPAAGVPQDQFRAVRDEFMNGKMVAIPRSKYLGTKRLFKKNGDFFYAATGLRNPFRLTPGPGGSIYAGVVGDGSNSPSETIVEVPNILSTPMANFCWPCIEGSAVDSDKERLRQSGVKAAGWTLCNACWDSRKSTASPDSAKIFRRPLFEYRYGGVDWRNTAMSSKCAPDLASITAVLYYTGTGLPKAFQNTVFFSDYSKLCTYYFEKNGDGSINWKKPRVFLANNGFVHLATGPDGFIYGTDYDNARVTRIAYDPNLIIAPPTPSPTTPSPTGPDGGPKVYTFPTAAGQCRPNIPELEWKDGAKCKVGWRCGTLGLGAVEYNNKYGTTRTRAFNKLNPTIRMKPCGKYRLTLKNKLTGWGDPVGGDANVFKDPQHTNLHVHGLHISGESPADNVIDVNIGPGQEYTYEYEIPCDHAGGLYFYHAHHHGSTTVQAGGGAVGLLVIDENPEYEGVKPLGLSDMAERLLLIEAVDPAVITAAASAMRDKVWRTSAADKHYLVNKCPIGSLGISVPAERWMRLRMLHAGSQDNVKVRFGKPGDGCTVGLLAKDGVYLAEVPRDVTNGELFFSTSSRVDIVVRCTRPGTYPVQLFNLGQDAAASTWARITSIRVTAALPPGPQSNSTLPTWRPCRPVYLQNLLTEQVPGANKFSIQMQSGLNSVLYSKGRILRTVKLNQTYELELDNTSIHPFHMHVNHMMIVSGDDASPIPGWHQSGDWVDTYSGPNAAVRFRPERYAGRALIHCHIYAHSDKGMVGTLMIKGVGGPTDNQGADPASIKCT